MSYDHRTEGFGEYESFVNALKLVGIPYTEELKDEAHVRGADLEHLCWCSYADEQNATCPCCDGTCGHVQRLRIARFTAITINSKSMAVEEYLAVADQDCDGVSIVDIAIYPAGERPDLQTQVLEA